LCFILVLYILFIYLPVQTWPDGQTRLAGFLIG